MNEHERERIAVVETNQKHIIKKVDELCTAQKGLNGKIDKIMSNDLPHLKEVIVEKVGTLEKKMSKLDKKIALNTLKIAGVLFVGSLLGGIVTCIIIKVLGI